MSARVQALFEGNIRKVCRAFEEGQDIKRIARRVGVSPPTITRWLTMEGYRHKSRGRYPVAMKSRVRDLSRRGWSDERIARLIGAPLNKVVEWGSLEQNPILGGRDPLRIRGGKRKKSVKKTQSRVRQYDPNWVYERGRWRKVKAKRKKGSPPPRHKCRKKWTREEKAYVLKLMERGLSILAIYRRMRASRKRQLKIWREAGKKGWPPGFPSPAEGPRPPRPIGPPSVRPGLTARAEAELKMLEEEAAEVAARRAAIEAKLESDKKAIASAEKKRKAIAEQIRGEKQRAEALAAWAAKQPKPRRKLVEAGSYEAEVLKLPVGAPIPKDVKRRRVKKPKKGITDWADNKRYFVVSNDWADLKKAKPDELKVVAAVLTSSGWPAKAEASGDQPQAYLSGDWGTRKEKQWERIREIAFEVMNAYKVQKKKLARTKKYDIRTAQFIVAASDAARKKTAAKEERRLKAWMNLGVVGQMIARFRLGLANARGEITPLGMTRADAARHIIRGSTPTKDAKRIGKRLEPAKPKPKPKPKPVAEEKPKPKPKPVVEEKPKPKPKPVAEEKPLSRIAAARAARRKMLEGKE